MDWRDRRRGLGSRQDQRSPIVSAAQVAAAPLASTAETGCAPKPQPTRTAPIPIPVVSHPTIDLARLDRERYEADKKILRGYDVEATIPLGNIPSELHDWPLERLTDVARMLAQGSEIVMLDSKDRQFVVITGRPDGVLWKIWREE